MNLNVGERLPGCGPAHQPGGYVVSALVAETPWYGLYTGKKIFYNFDFTSKRLRETDEAEWVDVFLRTVRYPYLDDPAYVARRRELARGEVRRILGGRVSNLWPEPIDLLEVANTRDPFAFAQDEAPEPIVVFGRPHGSPLGDWQQTVLPLASILGVLAELLEFIRQAHAEGLLLLGLGPAAVLVDRSDRVHYLGTDMVIEAARADLAAPVWSRLFPPDRFPGGFSAPELFEGGTGPDARADLYAWACLAYFLLTGQSPVQIALEQGKTWAHFQEVHFTRLAKSLGEVPAAHVRHWAEQLGVSDAALLKGWPDNVVLVFRALLHADPRRRPGAVEELLTWTDAPPPVPPAAVLALMSGPGEAQVHLDWAGLGYGLDMVIRRGVGRPPLTPADGTLLEQGPARSPVPDPAVPLTPETIHYTVFARRNDSGGAVYSAGTSTELEETSPAAVLRLADREAQQNAGSAQLPPRVALLFSVEDEVEVAQALARSNLAVVRGWAAQELDSLFRADPLRPGVEEALQEGLRDPEPDLCRRAAAALLTQPQTDESILRLARFAGQGNLDDTLHMVDIFAGAGLDEAQAERVREVLEEERPTNCPECQAPLARRDRAGHLRREHGYMEVGGSVLPRPLALERLWDRVFFQGERESHERVVEVLARGDGLAPAYVANLEEALTRRADLFGLADLDDESPEPSPVFQPYLECLMQVPEPEALLSPMLGSSLAPVRTLARRTWLSILGAKLRSEKVTGKSLGAELERLGPNLEEKILLCRRLPEAGIDRAAARACLALLEGERPAACVECGTRTRLGNLEKHLRRAHGIYQFRGVRRSFPATRDVVLAAVCAPVPDESAWQTLADLARDHDAEEADGRLVTWLCHALHGLERKPRAAALTALAEILAQAPDGPKLLAALVRPLKTAAYQVLARQLVLEVGARLAPPVADAVIHVVKPLLSDRSLPRQARQDAVVGLVRTTGKTGPAAVALLEAYVVQTGKLRAIDKLHELEQRIGQAAALDELCARLEDQVRMTCPKCATEMMRIDMVPHLWDRHRLVLEGRRVREPRRVLDDWVVDYALEKDPVILGRCRDLAQKLDPAGGAVLLERTLLRHGIEDREALADLSARAESKHATLCPHCFGEVTMPLQPPPLPLVLDKDRLAGAGFRVAVVERGLFPTLEVETPAELIYQGREPGTWPTRQGALVLLVGPLVLAFFVVTELLTRPRLPALFVFVMALGLGMLLGGLVHLFWPSGPVGTDRLLGAAWGELVPDLLEDLKPEAIAFLGGLASASVGKGDAGARAGMVGYACEKLDARAGAEPGAQTALAALVRLAVEDGFERDEDPLPLLAEQVERCLRCLLPLAHAAQVLEDFFGPGAPVWPRGLLARLQVLVCARAFGAGLELNDLVDVGRTQPTLAAAFGLADLDRLAQLRQLWALRLARPWERSRKATTVFDLADDAERGEKTLGRTPDLLLQVRDFDITLGSQGVWFQDVCLTEMPARVVVEERRIHDKNGYDVVAGSHYFWFAYQPHELAAELERWLGYYFRDFVPHLAAWHTRPASDGGKRLRNINALACPECRCALLGRVGSVAVRVE
jgi:hypothetical protein